MTAAPTSREITPKPALRGATANTAGPEIYDDVPILLRLPNVAPDAKLHRAHESPNPTAVKDGASGRQNRSSRRGQSTSRESQTDRQPVATARSEASTTTKLLALAWRVGIVTAAIGLVVLAYQIINGSPASPEAPTSEIGASSDETNPTPSPAPFALASPSSLSELSPGPTIVEPTATGVPSRQPYHSIGAHEYDSPATNPSGAGIVGPENTLPIGAPEGADDAWNRSPTYDDQWRNDTAHSPTAGTNGPTTGTNGSTTGTNNPTAGADRPTAEINGQRPWAPSEPDRGDVSSSSWPNAESQPHDDQGYDYPVSDPRTWRTPADWYAPSANARIGFEQSSSSWEEESRSAARLRPEIEQPPLPR